MRATIDSEVFAPFAPSQWRELQTFSALVETAEKVWYKVICPIVTRVKEGSYQDLTNFISFVVSCHMNILRRLADQVVKQPKARESVGESLEWFRKSLPKWADKFGLRKEIGLLLHEATHAYESARDLEEIPNLQINAEWLHKAMSKGIRASVCITVLGFMAVSDDAFPPESVRILITYALKRLQELLSLLATAEVSAYPETMRHIKEALSDWKNGRKGFSRRQ